MKLKRLATAGWTSWHAVAATVMMALAVLVTWPAWKDIVGIAMTVAEQSHILLVPFVAAWMAWCRRIRLRFCTPQGTLVGMVIAIVGWAMYSVGFNQGKLVLWHAGAIMVVVGAVLSILGKQILFRFMPAFAVLIFLVPVPGQVREMVALPLQTATAATTQAIIETIGWPIEREGNLLRTEGFPVAVAEACNGLRMVFALVLVSYAFAFSMPLRNGVRILVLLASPLAALVCNVIRLVPTIRIYARASKPVADMFHDASGWIMLPIAFLMLVGIVRMLKWALIPVSKYNLAVQ